ncbi:MAG TPA: hypothetical protein VEV39_11055 [Gemmatimonadales bacterium]|nr:hypothetical protein [Gemmatimonadales bacterium]
MSTRRRLSQSLKVALTAAVTCASCKVGSLVDSGTATLGDATHLMFVTQPSNGTAGEAMRVQVSAVDSNGAVVAVFNGQVTLALADNPGNDQLHGTVTVTAIQGTATFADVAIDHAASGYSLSAATTGLTGATSGHFDVAAGAPATATYTTQPTSTSSGSTITPAVQVQVVDAFGNPVTAYSGNVTIALAHDGSVLRDASLQGTTTVTATSGRASFSNLHIDQSGLGYTLGAGVPTGGTPEVSQPFDVVPL